MKKSIFYYLFAVVCTVCLFSACSDDDDDDNKGITVAQIVGTYPGEMDITLAGNSVTKDLKTSIKVEKVSDSKVKIVLAGFTIPGILPQPMDITADCDVTSSTNELKLAGNTSITVPGIGALEAKITGDADGKELDLKITVESVQVVVDFDGQK